MIKSVIVKIKGDCEQGFSAELRSGKKGEASTKVIEGSFPPSSELPQKQQNWQSNYRKYGGMGSSTRTLKAKKAQVTHVSLDDSAEELGFSVNDWLNSAHPQYRRFRDKLVGELQGEGKISLVIQTDDLTLWRLPWQLWDVLEDNKVEVSICPCEYEKAETVPITKPKNRVRILVIIGDSRGINTKKDLKL
ncbi:MAG: sensor protein Chase2, partial [Okeania sp. SIO2H7]|nr:sensor protein Chase2 [Okeania sp. SIO2H7]